MDTADTSPADGAVTDQSETAQPEQTDQPEAAESTSQSAPGEPGTVGEQPKMQPEAVTAGSCCDKNKRASRFSLFTHVQKHVQSGAEAEQSVAATRCLKVHKRQCAGLRGWSTPSV